VATEYVKDIARKMLAGEIQPHELPAPLHDLWRDGFTCGQLAAGVRIDRLNREADDLWFRLHNPAEARAERDRMLKAFDVVQARRAADTRLEATHV
jgi:hypothetical protein